MFVCLFSYLWSVLGCGEETILIWEMFLAIARTKSKGLSDSACLPIIKSPTDPDTILPQRESQRGMFLLEDFLFFLLTLSTILFLSLGKGLATKLDEFSGQFPTDFDPPPSPVFSENYNAQFYNGYVCIYASRYEGQIV